MALGRQIRKIYDITNAGAAPALGNKLKLRIERRSNLRLETIVIHANLAVTGTTFGAAKDGLEGLFEQVRLVVTDQAGSSRPLVKCPSAFLTHWHKDREGRHGRYTQTAMNSTTTPSNFPTTGTYDIFFMVHILPPGVNSAIGTIFSLPLQDRIGEKGDVMGIGDDPQLELDVATAFTSMGIATGAVTFNFLKAHLLMREVAPRFPYAPSALEYATQLPFSSTSESEIQIPSSGHLLAIAIEEFASATARGNALDVTPATLGYWKLRYGRTEVQEWYTKMQIERSGHFNQDYPEGTAGFTWDKNAKFFHSVDFLHDTTLGEAFSGASSYNLYTENRGDSMKLVATRPVSGAQIGLATWKLFAPISLLDGI